MEPSPAVGVLLSGGSTMLGGRAWGTITRLTVTVDGSDQEPLVLSPVPYYWQVGPVLLKAGDNRIQVVAENDTAVVASDRLVVTHYATPLQEVQLQASPAHVVRNVSTRVRFTAPLQYGQIDSNQVNLYVVDGEGANLSPVDVVKMKDDGLDDGDSACDLTAGDGIYSICKSILPTGDGDWYGRARINVTSFGVVDTPVLRLQVVDPLTEEACNAIESSLLAAQNAYVAAGNHEAGVVAAQGALADGGASATGAAAHGLGVWAQYGGGALAAVSLGLPAGSRATQTVGSRRMHLLSPLAGGSNEVAAAATAADDTPCPPFENTDVHDGGAAKLEQFRSLSGAGYVSIAAHGGAFFQGMETPASWRFGGEQEVLWSGQSIDCSQFSSAGKPCAAPADCASPAMCVGGRCAHPLAADVADGRVVFGLSHWGITPAFVSHYADGGLANAVVTVGACYSHYNATMARAFVGAGAGAYMGFSGPVSDAFATAVGEYAVARLVGQLKPLSAAICYDSEASMVPGVDDTVVRLSGNGSLSLDLPGLLNPGFEEGALAGWTTTGDTRQVSEFCGTQPIDGKFMALLTTGMGLSSEPATVSQRFCLPSDAQTMTIAWRYLSAELESTCGLSGVQDTWTAQISGNGGAQELVIRECTVNDMCHYEAAFCLPKPCNPGSSCTCGDCFHPYEPVPGCMFGNDSVQGTAVQQETVNISAFAGAGAVTLTFSVDDKSKHVYDTAIVIDAIKVQ